MKNLKFLIIVLAVIVAACDKAEVDNTAPIIVVEQPANEQEFHPEDTVSFKCLFTDDVALKSYKIDIHYGGSHEHKSASVDEVEWHFEQTWSFDSGLKESLVEHSEIVIPELVEHDGLEGEIKAGEYHFGVYCTDMAGNVNQEFIDIVIEHEDHDHE